MPMPQAFAERRKRQDDDRSIIQAAREVMTAENAARWQVATWIDQDARDRAEIKLQAALASLREVVVRHLGVRGLVQHVVALQQIAAGKLNSHEAADVAKAALGDPEAVSHGEMAEDDSLRERFDLTHRPAEG